MICFIISSRNPPIANIRIGFKEMEMMQNLPTLTTPRNSESNSLYHLMGILLVAISGISFGTAAIFVQKTYAAGTTPVTLLFLRFAGSALFLIPIALLQKRPFPHGKKLLGLFLMGALGKVGMSYNYFSALELIPASLAVLLLYAYPALVAALSVAMRLEKFSLKHGLALGLALFGVVLTAGAALGGSSLGIVHGLAAAVFYALYIVAGYYLMDGIDPLVAVAVVMASAGASSGVWMIFTGFQGPATLTGWSAVLALVLLSTVIASLTFFFGMKRIGPIATATISTLEPVTGVILAALVLNEPLTPAKMIGGSLIIIASIILAHIRSSNPLKEAQANSATQPKINPL